jgi:hypothetical protein
VLVQARRTFVVAPAITHVRNFRPLTWGFVASAERKRESSESEHGSWGILDLTRADYNGVIRVGTGNFRCSDRRTEYVESVRRFAALGRR